MIMFIKARKLVDFLHSSEMKEINEVLRACLIVCKVFYLCSFYRLFRLCWPVVGIDGPEDLHVYLKLFISKTNIFDSNENFAFGDYMTKSIL